MYLENEKNNRGRASEVLCMFHSNTSHRASQHPWNNRAQEPQGLVYAVLFFLTSPVCP